MRLLRTITSPLFAAADLINKVGEPYKEPNWDFTAPAESLDVIYQKCKDGLANFLKADQRIFFYETPSSLGDVAIWHGVYSAWAAIEGNPSRVTNALNGMSLLSGNVINKDGVLLRGVCKKGEATIDHNWEQFYGETGDLMWRADASLDQLIGFCYGLTWMKLKGQSVTVTDIASRLASGMQRNNYKMLNPDGSTTTYGDLTPRFAQAPVRLLALLLLLKLAGFDKEYEKIYRQSEPWLQYGETHFLGRNPWFAHNFAFLVYDALRRLDPNKKVYAEGMKRLWEKDKIHGNLMFHVLMNSHEPIPNNYLQMTLNALARYNYPKIKDAVEKINSTRTDIAMTTYFKKRVSIEPLQIQDRIASDFLWQRCPFDLDGWQGVHQAYTFYSGLDFLLLYDILKHETPS